MLATLTLTSTASQVAEHPVSNTQPLALFTPSIKQRYQIIKQLYKAEVGNTVVSIVQPLDPVDQICGQSSLILKEIDLSYLSESHLQQSRTEFIIQMSLHHENIVRCLEFEERNGQMLAVLEL